MQIRIIVLSLIISAVGYTLTNPRDVFSGLDIVEQKMLAARAETVYASTGMQDMAIISKLTIDGQVEFMSRIVPENCFEARDIIEKQRDLLLKDRSKVMSPSEFSRQITNKCKL